MKEIKHTVIRKGQKNSTNEHITLILELTREIRLGWNVQHEGKRFSVAHISRIGVSSRNKKICTARQQTNREFVNGLNSHYDPHRNFFRRRINDLQRDVQPPGFFSFLYLKKIKISKIYGRFENFQNYTPVAPCLGDRRPLAGRQDLNVKKIYIQVLAPGTQ